MRRLCVVVCLAVAFLSLQLASNVLGQPPELLRNYRFLPRHSTLHVTGGFAGFDIEANVFGRYGLVTGFDFDDRILAPISPLIPFAKFVDVDAVAINPADFGPYSFDLDQSLNLSGLEGRPLPIFFPAVLPNIEVFKFEGEDGQGAPMTVHALTVGRWMFMRGANDTSCCDFFDYRFRSLARQTAFADTNDDGSVDSSDLAAILGGIGSNAASASGGANSGDADGDGDTDGNDFLAWQRQYREEVPAIEYFDGLLDDILASSTANATGVPEPGSLALLGMLAAVGLCVRRKR